MIKGLPEKLKALRTKHGYSQKQIADRLNISPSIVSGYETGERTPSTDVLLELSYLLNCSTDYLLGKQQTEPSLLINTDGLSDKQIQAICTLIESIKNKWALLLAVLFSFRYVNSVLKINYVWCLFLEDALLYIYHINNIGNTNTFLCEFAV